MKREEARKRAVALMKKNWKSQHLSLGLTRNDLKPPSSRVTGASSKFPESFDYDVTFIRKVEIKKEIKLAGIFYFL